MRDALNSTGKAIFHSMCWGAGATIAKVSDISTITAHIVKLQIPKA